MRLVLILIHWFIVNFNYFFRNRKGIYSFLIFLLTISFPLGFLINTLSIYAILIFFFLDYKKNISSKLKDFTKSRLVMFYFLFFVVQLFGLIYSENFTKGLTRSTQLLPFIFLPGIINIESRNHNFQRIYFFLKLGIPVVFILLAFLYYFSDNFNGITNMAQNWFVDKVGISQFYVIFILLLPIFFCIRDLNKKKLIFNSLIIIICSCFILLMNNFSGLVFLIISLIIYTKKIYSKSLLFKFIPLLIGLTIAVISILFINTRIEKKYHPLLTTSLNFEQIKVKNKFGYTRNTLEHRIYINYLAVSDWKQTFPFGLGTGDSQPYLNHLYSQNSFLVGMSKKLNAHNQFLEEYLKTGIFGLAALLVLFYQILSISKREKPVFFGYILFFVLACFVESYLNRYHGIIICSGIIPFLLSDQAEL